MNLALRDHASDQFDQKQIALLRGLRNGALLPQLMHVYREQVTGQIQQLRMALDGSDYATIRVISHTLKSASFSVGAKQIGELCADLEASVITENFARCPSLIAALDSNLQMLLPQLDEYLKS